MSTKQLVISTDAGDSWASKPSVGTFDPSSDHLNLGGSGSNDEVHTWIPFRIPFGKKSIVSASIQLVATKASTGTKNVAIGCEAADNPSDPVNLTDLRARVLTTAQTNVNLGTYVIGTTYSYDVTAAVQEVVNRAGWVSNNRLAVLILGTIADNAYREVASFENTIYLEPRLVINVPYFVPGVGGLI